MFAWEELWLIDFFSVQQEDYYPNFLKYVELRYISEKHSNNYSLISWTQGINNHNNEIKIFKTQFRSDFFISYPWQKFTYQNLHKGKCDILGSTLVPY